MTSEKEVLEEMLKHPYVTETSDVVKGIWESFSVDENTPFVEMIFQYWEVLRALHEMAGKPNSEVVHEQVELQRKEHGYEPQGRS